MKQANIINHTYSHLIVPTVARTYFVAENPKILIIGQAARLYDR